MIARHNTSAFTPGTAVNFPNPLRRGPETLTATVSVATKGTLFVVTTDGSSHAIPPHAATAA